MAITREQLNKFEKVLGETLILESEGKEIPVDKANFIRQFQEDFNIPQVFSRELLKLCGTALKLDVCEDEDE